MQSRIRDENIFASPRAECVHFNQELQDKFDIKRFERCYVG